MINSLGGEQDNVVFLGRKSFRMEIAAGPRSNELPIPIRSSAVPTEKIFEADRDREAWIERATATGALQPEKLKSGGTSVVALCVTTFVLGIALTLTFTGRAAPRRAPAQPAQLAAPAQPAPAIAPAQPAAQATAPTPTPSMIVQPMPIAAPTDAEILAGFALAPSRRPLAKSARAARPRPVRAAQLRPSAEAEDPTVADPFADPVPAPKPAAVKPAVAKPAVAKSSVAKSAAAKPAADRAWVDPFAE